MRSCSKLARGRDGLSASELNVSIKKIAKYRKYRSNIQYSEVSDSDMLEPYRIQFECDYWIILNQLKVFDYENN